MCRQAKRVCITLAAGLLLGSGELTATTIRSTSYTEWMLGLSGVPAELDFNPITTSNGSVMIVDDSYSGANTLSQDSPVSESATGALCGGGLLVLFGSVRRKYPRQQL